MNDEQFKTHYFAYQSQFFKHAYNATQTIDTMGWRVHRELSTVRRTTPFLIQTFADFVPDVYKHRHQLTVHRHRKDQSRAGTTVKKLVRASNEAAKHMEYKSYKAMCFELENLDEKRIKYGLVKLIGYQGKKRIKLKKKHGITADNFYDILKRLGPKPRHTDAEKIFTKVHNVFEKDSFANFISITVDDELSGAHVIQEKSSHVRVHTPAIKTMWQLKNFLHELSKALILYYQEANPPKHFLRPAQIEAFSSMLEQLVIQKVCSLTEKKVMRDLQVLENSWYASHALFEFDLHDALPKDEEAYRNIINPIFTVEDASKWPLNAFDQNRLLTMHYKPIGVIMYDNLNMIAKKDKVLPHKKIAWIKTHILTRLNEVGIDTLI